MVAAKGSWKRSAIRKILTVSSQGRRPTTGRTTLPGLCGMRWRSTKSRRAGSPQNNCLPSKKRPWLPVMNWMASKTVLSRTRATATSIAPVLLCHSSAGADCLTQPQIDALKQVYAGPKDPKTGKQIYPGYETGTEAEPGAWLGWIVPFPQVPQGSIQSLMGNGLFSLVVYEDPKWDWHSMDFERDVTEAG